MMESVIDPYGGVPGTPGYMYSWSGPINGQISNLDQITKLVCRNVFCYCNRHKWLYRCSVIYFNRTNRRVCNFNSYD